VGSVPVDEREELLAQDVAGGHLVPRFAGLGGAWPDAPVLFTARDAPSTLVADNAAPSPAFRLEREDPVDQAARLPFEGRS